MDWYQVLSCDNTVKVPFVGDEGELGLDESELRAGCAVRQWPELAWVRASRKEIDGQPDDVLQTLFRLPIYSYRLRSALQHAQIDGIEYLPIKVLRPDGRSIEGFSVANILSCIQALDMQRSEYRLFPEDDEFPVRRGRMQTLDKVVLAASVLNGLDVIRLSKYRAPIFVSQRFVDVFERGGFTGYSFRVVCTV
jgi:hypothetical protein